MKAVKVLLVKFLNWRAKHISNRHFIMILSVIVGLTSGFAAVVIKNGVNYVHDFLSQGFVETYYNILYVVLPAFGLLLVFLFLKYVLGDSVKHGIPNVLNSIAKNNAKMRPHNMYSSVVTSTVTVGFGGSVGLEGPTVATGAAIGSNLGQALHLNYKQLSLLLSCASAAAMSAIFKAPVAGIVFAVEVIMVDLTTFSLVPLLLASASGVLTTYFFLGKDVLYPFNVETTFIIQDIPFYVALGILAGLISAYFTRIYILVERFFDQFSKMFTRVLIGSLILGVLVFLFPALYGEGYSSINAALDGEYNYLFDLSIFYEYKGSIIAALVLMAVLMLVKVVATATTFGAYGVGGIFAPTLFTGANTGLFFALLMKNLGIYPGISLKNFALIGMAGLIAGVLHAPLTGIFLIADITSGYELLMPLMITAIFSYVTVMAFEPISVYHIQLAKRRELVTHDKDKFVLGRMQVEKFLETNFHKIHPDATLGDLVKLIRKSRRNIFPVVDKQNNFHGMVKMDDIRHIMFNEELYNQKKVTDLMVVPAITISTSDSMDVVAQKFHESKVFNIPVVDNGKYMGFVSKANVFSSYRRMLQFYSSD